MKKIAFLISIILLFSLLLTSNVKASFVGGTCNQPLFLGCPDGYECWDLGSNNLYARGKKAGWTSYGFFGTDSGPRTYYVTSEWDVILLNGYTTTSKVLFTGNYKLTPYHPDQTIAQYNFGTPTSPAVSGYTKVSNQTLYTPSLGYGWSSTAGLDSGTDIGFDETTHSFVRSTNDNTFSVDLSNGEYNVQLEILDTGNIGGYGINTIDLEDVYAENNLVVNNFNSYTGNAQFVASFTVTVNDGQLNLKFHDDGGATPYWYIDAIVINKIIPVTEVSNLGSQLTYNGSNSYVFNPSYGFVDYACSHYGDCGVYYPDCGELMFNFSQTDSVDFSASFQYKTYILDFNEDNHVNVLDGIILSNQFGKSWGKPGDSVDPNSMTWRADVNSDGTVDVLDAIILKNQFGTNYTQASDAIQKWVPEW